MDNSDKSIMTINGAVATIESKQSKTLYMFYVVPNEATKVELKLN
jgi:hypothetical protein